MADEEHLCCASCAAMRGQLLAHLVEDREILLCNVARILGSRDRAEDVVQDAAIRCLESDAISDRTRSPRGLMRRIVLNLALDQRRRDAREKVLALVPGHEPPCARPGPEGQLAQREALRRIVSEIDSLSVRDRNIFVSHRLEARLQKEIARDTGLSPARINGIVGQIHARLRGMLEEAGGQDTALSGAPLLVLAASTA